jgi:hypothetical protein
LFLGKSLPHVQCPVYGSRVKRVNFRQGISKFNPMKEGRIL